MITRLFIAASVAVSFTWATAGFAADHPGYSNPPPPTFSQPVMRNQQSAPSAIEVTNADISKGIKRQIESDRKKSGDKKFHTKYAGKDLALDLIKVHDDHVSTLGGGKYFACVDMKATNGKTYDIDFFMAGKPGDMKVTQASVHKINGKPLYNWKEVNGVWKKVSA